MYQRALVDALPWRTFALIVCAAWTASAPAQEISSGSSNSAAPEDPLVEIVVTGSRVTTSAGFSSPTPLTVIDSEKIAALAPTTVGEALVRMPGFRDVSSSQQAGRFSGGAQFAMDLRGLGAPRTLMLVDGRRFVPTTAGGIVNTNMIPLSMVERIDVVTGGASSAYGSDAVAGVVNFIMRDRYDGLRTHAQYGISEEGDAAERTVGLVAGTSFADNRWHLVLGGEYSKSDELGTIYSRDWSSDNQFLVGFGSSRPAGTPSRALMSDVTFGSMTEGSLVLTGPLAETAFGAGGVPYTFQPGPRYSNLMVGGGTPSVNPAGNYRLIQPVERYATLGRLTYDLTDETSVFVEASYGDQSTDSYITWYQSPRFTVSSNNPFIPAATRAQMEQLGLTSLTLGRINTDIGGGRYYINEYDTARYVLGARGRIFDAIAWDAYFEHGESHVSQTTPTDVLTASLLASFYAVTGPDGQAVCAPLDTNPNLTAAQRALVQPGCVPFNVFGSNSRSQAAYDYVTHTAFWENRVQQDVAALNVRFKPFSTWSGQVSAASGVEAREESTRLVSDPLSELNAHSLSNAHAYRGSHKVKEVYLEMLLPLAAGSSWAKAVDLDIAGRVTDYSTSGTVETWKAGLTYDTPFGLRLRGTRSRDIRAPSLADLFDAGTFGAVLNGAVNPLNGQTGAVNAANGGNPDLEPEVSDTLTAGVVYEPEWLDGFGMSADYYDIKIADVITTPTAADVLNRCAAGVQAYCALIVTDSSPFGIAYVRLNPVNLARRSASGVDIELNYRLPADRWFASLPGAFSVRAIGSYVRHLEIVDAGGAVDRAGSGVGGLPEWTWNVDTMYSNERFSTTLNLRYFNSIKYDSTLVGPEDAGYDPAASNSVNINRFPGRFYVNWFANVNLGPAGSARLQLYTSVNNVLDRDPPKFAMVAFAQGGNPYPVPGRYYRVGLRYSF